MLRTLRYAKLQKKYILQIHQFSLEYAFPGLFKLVVSDLIKFLVPVSTVVPPVSAVERVVSLDSP
jgi:hypothetical protein